MPKNIKPKNVNPDKWGPIFWSLLHTIAQYSNIIPESHNAILQEFVTSIPYVLPCSQCSKHCHEIYNNHDMIGYASLYNFPIWVHTLRTEVNKYTKTSNISYEKYSDRLRNTDIFITKHKIINLFVFISQNYPYSDSEEDEYRKLQIFNFVNSLMELIVYIPHLKSLNNFKPTSVWQDKQEFQIWLKRKCDKVYSYNLNIDSED